jgi:hypothetical protein
VNYALAKDLRRILGQISKWGMIGHFLLVAGVLAGPWEADAATIALIGAYSTGYLMALGGLLTLMAVLHGVSPKDVPGAVDPEPDKGDKPEPKKAVK